MSLRGRVNKIRERLQVPRAHSLPRLQNQDSGCSLNQMVKDTMFLVLPPVTGSGVRRRSRLQRSPGAVEIDDLDFMTTRTTSEDGITTCTTAAGGITINTSCESDPADMQGGGYCSIDGVCRVKAKSFDFANPASLANSFDMSFEDDEDGAR